MASLDRKYSNMAGSLSSLLDYIEEEQEDLAREMEGLELGLDLPTLDGGGNSAGAVASYLTGEMRRNARKSPNDVMFSFVGGTGAQIVGTETMSRKQMTWAWEGKWPGFNECKKGSRASKSDPTVRETGVRNAGFDISFAGPKSLSIYMVACPDAAKRAAIMQVFNRAVETSMRSVEDHALLARPKASKEKSSDKVTKMQGGATERTPAKIMWVRATQWAARPTPLAIERGYHADIHLHQHALLFSMGFVPDASEPSGWKAKTIDSFGLKRHAAERDNIFMAELARGLESLGVQLDYSLGKNGKTYFEIKGVNLEACEYFSTNSAAAKKLERALEKKHGRKIAPYEVRDAMKKLRREKDNDAKALDKALNRQVYLDALEAAGLSAGDLDFDFTPPAQRTTVQLEEELHRRLEDPDIGLCQSSATVTADEVRAAVARCNVGVNLSYDEMMDFYERYLAELELIQFPDGRQEYTTFNHVLSELWLEGKLEAKLLSKAVAPPQEIVLHAIESMERPLNSEQRDGAIDLASDAGLSVLIGPAGAGKSSALKANVAAWRAINPETAEAYVDKVIVLSTSNQAAHELDQKVKADWATSVEKFELALKNPTRKSPIPTSRSVIIVDEAAMMDNARIQKVLDLAGDAKIVLVGDDQQLTAIGVSGWWQRLVRKVNPTALREVHRHNDARDTEAFNAMRVNDIDATIDSLEERGRFSIAEDAQGRVKEMMTDYRTLLDPEVKGRGLDDIRVIVDSSNVEVDLFNRFVQYELQERNLISTEGFAVQQTEGGREWTLHASDHVVFLTPYYDRAGKRVNNSEKGVITSLDTEAGVALVQLASGDEVTVRLNAKEARQPLGLAYTQHTSKFQGGEVNYVLYAPGGAGVSNKNSAYSSLTREIEEVRVYLDKVTHGEEPLDNLRVDWRRSAVQTPLMDLLEMHNPERYSSLSGKSARPVAEIESPAKLELTRRTVHTYDIIRTHRNLEFAKAIITDPAFPYVYAELAKIRDLGGNPDDVLRQAIDSREFGTAESPAKVLHFRLAERRKSAQAILKARGEALVQAGEEALAAQRAAESVPDIYVDVPLPDDVPMAPEELESLPPDDLYEPYDYGFDDPGPEPRASGDGINP